MSAETQRGWRNQNAQNAMSGTLMIRPTVRRQQNVFQQVLCNDRQRTPSTRQSANQWLRSHALRETPGHPSPRVFTRSLTAAVIGQWTGSRVKSVHSLHCFLPRNFGQSNANIVLSCYVHREMRFANISWCVKSIVRCVWSLESDGESRSPSWWNWNSGLLSSRFRVPCVWVTLFVVQLVQFSGVRGFRYLFAGFGVLFHVITCWIVNENRFQARGCNGDHPSFEPSRFLSCRASTFCVLFVVLVRKRETILFLSRHEYKFSVSCFYYLRVIPSSVIVIEKAMSDVSSFGHSFLDAGLRGFGPGLSGLITKSFHVASIRILPKSGVIYCKIVPLFYSNFVVCRYTSFSSREIQG